MTLIQTILSPTRILQVSDRRLTKEGERVSDSTNKVVSWCGKFFVAFTGPAFMDHRASELPTSEWIAATLARNGDAAGDVTAVVDMLQASLDYRVGKLPRYWDKRMTVTMSGFAKFDDIPGDGITSVCYCISNYERSEDDGVKIYPDAFPDFETRAYRYTGDVDADVAFIHRTDGHPFGTGDMRLIKKLGPRLYRDQNWDGMVRLMIKVQRAISERADPKKPGLVSRVGLDAMVMSLPRLSYDDPMGETLLADISMPDLPDDRPAFMFVPEAGFSGEAFGPHHACRGKAMNLEGEDLNKYIRKWDPPAHA
ncbi:MULTISPECIES: hypothetical protein [Mycolicibacterium]|jgi:hypothetical protein|uniref:hypothetical protein n=1 Tax=Mycolicibacterium TaxID=1866885 RepID=UPI00298D3692|nr:hypothetical protein [Mycolicibacterium sp. D5.8-2]MDW5611270.1 hypothetical protein [Mycolicibacterium sp. D5.8-2]